MANKAISKYRLSSALAGAAVGGGAGAATALDGSMYNYLSHPQLVALKKQIDQQCGGDANSACALNLEMAAEATSRAQEQQLVDACTAAGPSCNTMYSSQISEAVNYLNDPLARQLNLGADQAITMQDYLNQRSAWGLVVGDNGASQNGALMLVPPAAAISVVGGPIILGAGATIGGVTGGITGYQSGGTEGALIGAGTGAVVGKYAPGASLWVSGLFESGSAASMFAGTGTFMAINGVATGGSAALTNIATAQPWDHGVVYAALLGASVPLFSGEAFAIGAGGERLLGASTANALSAYSGFFSIVGTAMAPTPPTPAKPPMASPSGSAK